MHRNRNLHWKFSNYKSTQTSLSALCSLKPFFFNISADNDNIYAITDISAIGKSVMTETIIPSRALGAKSPSGDHQEGLRRGGCPMSWYSLNGCSELLCVSEGANLVSIHSQGTHLCWTWVGLSDVLKEGSWMWSVGSAYDFDYRAAQEPNSVEGNKHCVDESYGPGHSFFYMPHSGCLHCWFASVP
uniref:C-type lectin domain-containing protein n=1 Tax=Mola mola TaxID=94237 RepID=A0A3Q3XIN2_MOLML